MHKIVKLIKNEDGEIIENIKWCLVVDSDSSRTFCSGESYLSGDGIAEGEEKLVKRGGITCIKCLEKIKLLKSIKL